MTQAHAPSYPQPSVDLRHRITVVEFTRMFESGVFPDRLRLELLDGELFEMNPMLEPHMGAMWNLSDELPAKLGKVARVGSQLPIDVIDDVYSAPEPDFVIIARERYTGPRIQASEVSLLIEVSASSLEKDRGRKLPLYARNGVLEVWIINTDENQLEVYRKPSGQQYLERTIHLPGEEVAPLEFPEISIRWW